MKKKCSRKIKRKKALLNFLLKYLSTNNKLILYISQDLDKLINKNQNHIFNKYMRKNLSSNPVRKVA
ncbi:MULTISPECIES: hypothetical protein [unclassified Clostridium]|uniref:hypothetical protein n=1 Tax=unclassified Clostridium TaxID=2614128 RepID=UPI0025B8A919|nr:hypothetical protein [Clostridium sp.]MCI6693423.1 hypothetical protein [Clostridium sp.]MDY2631265.1 hypothetical protein [Clostridium sp.]MDY4252381.1 hypothetical protein [Clostridium sp.]MDY6228421.1 hypothetical protein [Clostridium sp.]